MNSIFNMTLGMYHIAKINEDEMCKEFKERAKQNIQEYWDACKYPRKTKKHMRKQAQIDYNLHISLSKSRLFTQEI